MAMHSFYQRSRVLFVAWGVFNIALYSVPVGAQTIPITFDPDGRPRSATVSGGSRVTNAPDPLAHQLQFVAPVDFSGEGRPTTRRPGGSRGECADQLIALVPGEGELELQPGLCNGESAAQATLTLSETPTFWFYVPEQPHANTEAEFVLLDEQEQPIVIEHVSLTGAPGIVSVQLQHPLELNRSYRWVFTTLVNPRSPSLNPTVEGIVRRIAPDETLMAELGGSQSARERIAIYAKHGIWQDALTELAHLREHQPNDASWMEDWTALLESVGLRAIANAPIH